MKQFLVLFLVFSILALSVNLFAKERKGAELIIQKTDGLQIRGELIAVKQNSLLLMERDSGGDVTTNIKDVEIITIAKKSKTLLWTGVGLIAGAVASSIWWMSVQEADDTSIINLYALAVGGGGGAVLGALIGSEFGNDITIQIEGKSEPEIQDVLEKLRKKARVRNFQ